MDTDRQICHGDSRGGFVLLTVLVFATVLSLLLTTALTVSYRLHADNRRAKERLRVEAKGVSLREETGPVRPL